MKKQQGFSLVEGLLIVLVLGVIGFGGYYVWSQQQKKNNADTSQQATPESDQAQNNDKKTVPEQEIDKPTSKRVSVKHFSIELPEGWNQNKDAKADAGGPEFYYEFSDDSGKSIGVSVNSGGFGGGGDGVTTTIIKENKFVLSNKYEPCNLEDETGVCGSHRGNDSLYLIAGGEYKGDGYTIWLKDEGEESQEAYRYLADIVETIELL